jgi:hypothetical protein
MAKRVNYIFSAEHVTERFTFQNEIIRVSEDTFENSFYADHNELGCSRSYDTPEKAIRMMLLQHGCTDIKIEGK